MRHRCGRYERGFGILLRMAVLALVSLLAALALARCGEDAAAAGGYGEVSGSMPAARSRATVSNSGNPTTFE